MTDENSTAAAAEAEAGTSQEQVTDAQTTEQPKTGQTDGAQEAQTTDAGQSAEGATDQSDATSGEDEGQGDQSQRKPNRVPAKDRIKELTAKRYEAERDAAEAKRRAERAEARLASLETPKPRREDFDEEAEFQAELAAHSSAQIIKKDREGDVADAKADAEAASKQATEAAQTAFQERIQEFAAKTPDYSEVVYNPSLPMSDEMANQIVQAEEGPQIAYWLGKNPTEAGRISRISNPTEVAREIGRIEGRINTPPPQRVTEAPKPVTAQATGSGSSHTPNPSKMNMKEYRAWREASAKGG